MALINLRNALMAGKRLPYDAEVEYLESTGTQYIDLGFSLTPSSDLYATVMLRAVVSTGVIFGQSYRPNWGANNPAYAIANSLAGKIFFAYGPSNNLYTSDIGVGTLADISYVGTTYTINGTTTTIPRVSSWSAIQGNAHVFCRGYADGTISPISKARVYSIKIVDNGATTHHYIPVRKGNVGYLYDRVSGKLFGNAGTGDFVLGPDVVPVEYLESTGTQYIDTGLFLSSDDTVTVSFSFTSSGGGSLFGAVTSDYAHWFNLTGVGNRLYFGSSTQYNTLSTLPANTICHVECGRNFYVNGVLQHTISATFDDGNLTTPIFARNHVSKGISNFFNGNIYRYTVSRGGSKRIDFRPVRVGTEGAMMDVLTRRIYRNAGTGAFTYGNDLKYPIPAE